MLKKIASVMYGTGAYLLFLCAFLYLMAFATNLGPRAISGPATMPALPAALIDAALITLFGLQHGIMARPAFKRWLTRFVPAHLERSTFVYMAAALVIAMVQFWQPIEGVLWEVSGGPMLVILAVSLAGWLTVPVTSFLTDHFELFGLRQVAEYALGVPSSKPEFRERAFYKKVRHPMMLGFMVAFWAAPLMTAGHLLFAGMMSAYILVGIYFEERDLARKHGAAYREYQQRVPKLWPFGKPEAQMHAPLNAKAGASRS
jgi:protein-S-isoprenylcysteine O-methyltransferase Ste14